MKYIVQALLLSIFLFFSACSDNAMVTTYDKVLAKEKIPCLDLVIFPPNDAFSKTLEPLYNFSDNCDFKLEVSKKSAIVCNSTHNIDKKALTNFPSSYLKMVVRKNRGLVYSYYIDLEEDVRTQNVVDGFERIQKDLKL